VPNAERAVRFSFDSISSKQTLAPSKNRCHVGRVATRSSVGRCYSGMTSWAYTVIALINYAALWVSLSPARFETKEKQMRNLNLQVAGCCKASQYNTVLNIHTDTKGCQTDGHKQPAVIISGTAHTSSRVPPGINQSERLSWLLQGSWSGRCQGRR
jgi:hypothetical protein